MQRSAVLLSWLLAAIPAERAAAQDRLPLEGGERVRVASHGVTAEYTVIGLRRDELLLRPTTADEVVFLSLPAIESISLHHERQPRQKSTGWYAGMGALVGGAAGAVTGYATGPQEHGCDPVCLTAGGKAAVLGVFFAATGTVLGALVGVVQPRGYWEEIFRR